jgi:pimeloyl-ACP methyl ester carboxylesterase
LPSRLAAAALAVGAALAVSGPGQPALGADPAPSAIKATALGKGPAIIFLHGTGASRGAWMPLARTFAGRYRIVVADLPGHGESPMLEPFTLKRLADEVAKLVAEQPTDSVFLVGQSFGGLAALELAVAHPKRLRGLVLVDLSPTNPLSEEQRKMLLMGLDQAYDEVIRAVFTRMSVDSTRGLRIHAQATLVPPAVVKSYLYESLYNDLASRMKVITVPVLLVATERLWAKDEAWPAAAERLGYTSLARLRVRRVSDSGTYVMLDQPDTLKAMIAAFVDSVVAGTIK